MPEHPAEPRIPKTNYVLRYASAEAARQESRLEAFRSRAGSLLAFAAVFAALSVDAVTGEEGGVLLFTGIVLVVVAAAMFLIVSAGFRLTRSPDPRVLADDYLYDDVAEIESHILRNTLDDIESNERMILQVEALYTFGLILLMLGTVVIGTRVAWLVL
jgi:hypothetical protein